MTTIARSISRMFKPKPRKPSPFQLGWGKSLLLALPMLLLTALMTFGQVMSSGQPESLVLLATLLVWVFLNVLFFLMLKTGRTDRYRALLFVVMALGFIVFFMTTIIETRGSLALTGANMVSGETPFCHLVIPMIIIPAALTRTIIFPGSLLAGFASVAGMIVIWTGASLVLGRAWCSWGCFYGGLDDGFSRLLKKPVIKNINRKWTYLPYAVLLGIVLTSAITLTPTYCEWLCPFKTVTEFEAITSIETVIKAVIFVSLFVSLVVVLPILTRRRTQCGLFCPLGAVQNWTNKVNVYDVRIDPEKCTHCGHCVTNCSTFSLDDSCMTSGRTLISCSKCGKCIDICPRQAISYHVKGTRPGAHQLAARLLFLYPAFLFLATFGGGMLISAIWRILRLVTTGSMI